MDLDRIRQAALSLNLDLVGVTSARTPAEHVQAYRRWLARGDYAGMIYMARADHVARREDPALIMPGARTALCVAVNYYPGPSPAPPDDAPRGRVANYAWGVDYHDWLAPRLERLAAAVAAELGDVRYRVVVDSGPLLERALAAQASLGFAGKNTCLIHPLFGSWLLLGEILLDVDLPAAEPLAPRCGGCTRCLDACPTGALVAPYRLDARRCISYLTIEHKGAIPEELRPLLGNWVFGCDVCQQVCPWQRFARPTTASAFQPVSVDRAAPPLLEWLALDEAGFRRLFAGTPLWRLGRARLRRNVAVALGNSGDRRALPALAAALAEDDPLLREHAAWALARIGEFENNSR